MGDINKDMTQRNPTSKEENLARQQWDLDGADDLMQVDDDALIAPTDTGDFWIQAWLYVQGED